MNLEHMSKEELLEKVKHLEEKQTGTDERERLLQQLQVHQVELEMQNSALREMAGTLEDSRSRYAELYDFAPIAYYTFDENGCILEVNLTGASMVGQDRARLIGMPFLPMVRAEEPAAFWAHLRRCSMTRAPVATELTFNATRAGRLDVQAVSTPVLSKEGTVVAYRTAFTDISDRKRAEAKEKAARREQEVLRTRIEEVDRGSQVVNDALASPVDTDRAVRLTIVAQAAKLTGAQFAVLGISDSVITIPKLPGIEGVVAAMPLSAGPLRVKDVRHHPGFAGFPASHPRITSLMGVPIVYGNVALGSLYAANKLGDAEFTCDDQQSLEMFAERVGYALEIARLNEGRARELARLELLADTGRALPSSLELKVTLAHVARLSIPRLADVAFVCLVEDGQVKFTSAAHQDPEREKQLVGLFDQFAPNLNEPTSLVGRVIHTREALLVSRVTPERMKASASPALLAASGLESIMAVPVISRGNVLGVLGFGSDRATRRFDSMDLALAEEIAFRVALTVDNVRLYQEAQAAIRSRDNVMAMVSHDLRNPLNAIFLNLGLLARPGPVGERRGSKRRVDLIKQSAERLNRLVEDLLTASTIEAGKFTANPQPENVGVLFDDALQALEPLAEERSLTLETSFAPELPRVKADRDRVLQVFSNLVGNAVKVTPPNSVIKLSARGEDGFVCFSVADSGPGIAEEHLSHVFNRYWKADNHTQGPKEGVGLGLYIVRGIVESHGGRVWVESPPRAGATFYFTLPVASA